MALEMFAPIFFTLAMILHPLEVVLGASSPFAPLPLQLLVAPLVPPFATVLTEFSFSLYKLTTYRILGTSLPWTKVKRAISVL